MFHHHASPFMLVPFNDAARVTCANARLRRKCRRWSKSTGMPVTARRLLREVTY